MQKSVLITGCSSGIGLDSALELKRQGFQILAGCRKPDDVARMNSMGFTGVLIDLDSPESVDRAADEVIALTDNRLYGIFNNAGYGVYGLFLPSAVSRWSNSFPVIFRRASAYHALTSRHVAAWRRTHCDDLIGDGADFHQGAALTPPANMRSKPGLTRYVWSYGTQALK